MPKRPLPPYASLIPQDMQDQLAALAEAGDNAEWALGDLVNEFMQLYFEDAKAELPSITKVDVYTAVGHFCGRSAETVRAYAYCSAHVPPKVREEYPALSRNHHKSLIPHAKGDIAKHRALCEEWLTKADEFAGSVGGVTALRAWLTNSGPEPLAPWVLRATRLVKAAEALRDEPTAPPAVVDLMVRLLVRWNALEEAVVTRSEHVEAAEADDRRPPE